MEEKEKETKVEETVEEVTAPAVPEEPKKKGFLHIPTREEKQLKKAEKLQRKIEKDSLELVVTMEPDDKGSAEKLTQMKKEDFWAGVKKAGAVVLTGAGFVTGSLFVVSRVLRHGTDNAIDTTFEEVSNDETSSEE